ncbi:hypothetical protein [Streptomyces sp. NPDC097619]|uniref:hypothetical protein n=1 Tax=Streptomyces sp. NPDC097619 TaxID=3157228 RepID=UPI00332E5CA1
MSTSPARRPASATVPAALCLALAAALLTGCSPAAEQRGGGGAAGAGDGVGGTAASSPRAHRALPFELYTHCGIDEARVGTTYFEAETPLSDGSGNPPEGWDNPVQRGTMTLESATAAVFTDEAGHEVRFRARPGATAFKRICA